MGETRISASWVPPSHSPRMAMNLIPMSNPMARCLSRAVRSRIGLRTLLQSIPLKFLSLSCPQC